MEKYFTHLHLHTEFSLLDGAIAIDKLIDFGKRNNFKALAISDHGNIFGAVKFFEKCKAANIKPILAMEAYFTDDVSIKSVEKKYYHLIIIVQNAIGYKNLCKLISYSYQQGFYFKPRIDYKILSEYAEGLIVTSACLGGHIPSLLMNNSEEEAEARMDWFLNVFGPDKFYFEVQPEDQEEQKILNQKLIYWSKKKEIQLLATADCHYVNLDDHEAHEIMLSIQTHSKIDDPDRFSFGKCRAYMRTQDQMLEIFKDNPEAVWNSGKIADMCDFDFQTGKLFFPKFAIPESHTENSYFKEICYRGFNKLLENDRFLGSDYEKYKLRLDLEIELIVKMGFVGYFLVVSDFIQWAKASDIPVGPGRGSAAGSLVAWAIEITNIDPIKYNLLFERFLNPERISMPDIDIDFCIEGREKVIQYIREKYGNDKVCQIITFGTMMAKGVIKDVARVLGFPFEDANALTDLVPDQLKISLNEAIEQEPKLKILLESNPKISHLFNIAQKLEGITRHASKHAAGIVISPESIEDVLPVYVPPKTTELVTQYAMTELESLGFLKIDLLGLKNLTLIDKVIKLIKKNHKIDIDIDKISLFDKKTFDLICKAKTSGVFQLESDGLKDVLVRLQPDKFEDIIAVNALYRPGPLGSGMVDDYIERRHGRQKIEYLFNELEEILQETYGVIVYQEQVIKIASAIGGYSLGEADILRRAMGKKKVDVMAKQRELFLQRSNKNGFDIEKAKTLFDLMEYFAGYGFNKSHSAAYALIAYQTAYLKANYLPEFMACLISLEATNAEKMVFYLEEAKDLGLEIAIPDINSSEIEFSVKNGKILFGLQGIKNVGLVSLQTIIAEREKKPFTDLLDFCMRIDLRTSNKRVLENLIYSGAFDNMPGNRAQKIAELQKIMDKAVEEKKAKLTGQMGLFKVNKTDVVNMYAYQPLSEFEDKEKLEKEKEVIGCYLSSHPLDKHIQLRWLKVNSFDQILSKINNSLQKEPLVITYGIKKGQRIIRTKAGDPMAFVQLEDKKHSAEIILFPKVFSKVEQWLEKYNIFVVKGFLDLASTTKCKIKANEFIPIDLFFDQYKFIEQVTFNLPTNFTSEHLDIIKGLKKGKTKLNLVFTENGKQLHIKTNQSINITTDLLQTIYSKEIGINLVI